ncbi:MAG TPA: dihydrodipicolinate reductase C-terminal domain-containing protein [Chlamydiales bacterium]|nr:dihydrodipicolinate reductase C-terminal domain-containing protein [Chlamydiales bacterium]
MSLKIAIIGATGRLGKAIATLALQDPSFQIAAAITHSTSPHLNTPYGTLLNRPCNLPISATRTHLPVDLFIDVSTAAALRENLHTAVSHEKPIVIGTTGLSAKDLTLLDHASQHIPLFYTPNFTLGMALLHKIAQHTASHFPNAHIDLIETHHVHKKDKPSASALSLAKAIAQPVNIHSLRSGAAIGEHTLLFNTPEERLTLSHTAHTRDAFARGALAAALFLSRQPPGLYNMDNLLD